MRIPFHQFCTPKKVEPRIEGAAPFAQLTHASSMQVLYKNPSIKVTTKIKWMPPGQLARKVISRSNWKPTYKFPSKKNNQNIHCESKHELNAMVILEDRDEVVSYQAQPAIITYLDEFGETHLHYPDILVTLNNGNKLLIEIKSDNYADCPETVWRTSHLHTELKPLGIQYLLVTESQLLASAPYIKRPLIGVF
jgi:hypothetical protein